MNNVVRTYYYLKFGRIMLLLASWIIGISLHSYSQIEVIPTGTNTSIVDIVQHKNLILLNGTYDYLGKLNDSRDSVQILPTPGPAGYINYNLNIVDSTHWYITSYVQFPHHSYVLITQDCGIVWDTMLDTLHKYPEAFFMFDTLEGYFIASLYDGFRTTDSGNSWIKDQFPLGNLTASKLYKDSIIVCGVNKEFMISSDRGKTWQGSGFVQTNPQDFWLQSPDSIIAVSGGGPSGSIFSYSTDGGMNWKDRSMNGQNLLPNATYFRSWFEGYVVGLQGSGSAHIYRTTDLGKTWKSYDTGFNSSLLDIEFINDSIALISGSNGLLFKWNKNSMPVGQEMESFGPDFSIHPNPSNSSFEVSFTDGSPVKTELSLLSLAGKEILTQDFAPSTQIKVDVSNISPGIYFLRVRRKGREAVRKLIVE